jgi:hypothetical protein
MIWHILPPLKFRDEASCASVVTSLEGWATNFFERHARYTGDDGRPIFMPAMDAERRSFQSSDAAQH